MNHGDAFAGIGGFGLAAKRAGWETVWACEIGPSARAVYAARLGHDGLRFDRDIRESRNLPPIDILTGGFPCQDLSVAGRRKGLSGSRSGLFFELVRILEESRPQWFVFENVPGLLSSNQGRDMGVVLSSLVECGYGVAWRILNSRYFGLAQNRERVFIVGHRSGSPDYPTQVLFDEESQARDSSADADARRDIAFAVTARTHNGGDPTTDNYVVGTMRSGSGCMGGNQTDMLVTGTIGADEARTQLVVAGTLGAEHGRNRGLGNANEVRFDDISYTQGVTEQHGYYAFNPQSGGSQNFVRPSSNTSALSRTQTPAIYSSSRSARMRKSSRLPGSLDVCPSCIDGPDSPRYRGLGNAVSPPVVEWIFKRINECMTPSTQGGSKNRE